MDASDQSDATGSTELLRLAAVGDQDAETEIFERYVRRLTSLARSRLAAKLATRVDAEDIVMSAYRSFFIAVRDGRFELHRGGDLWRLLVELTLHKLYRRSQYHLAQRRTVERETHADGGTDQPWILAGKEPTPDEALAAVEELEAVLGELNARDRHVIELRLQGYEYDEIADQLQCNERTVRRAVNEARRLMASRGGNNFVPSAARQRPKEIGNSFQGRERLPISDTDAPQRWADFILREQIGMGATGRVYRATRIIDGREFAIKFLRKSLTQSQSALDRFLAEAKTVAMLAHPGIVKMHGAGKTPGGGLFLLMDRVQGQDLQRVRETQAVSSGQAIRWIAAAAEIVQFAHGQGVIHCDLKPSNLLLDEAGQIHVSDFGFAVRLVENANRGFAVAGTPAFMAPEQVEPCWGEISPRTDVWGLGGLLYFLLYGRPPHEGSDVPSTLASVVSKEPVRFLDDSTDHVPAAVRGIMQHCLAKQLAERIESAGVLAKLLRDTVTSGS